MTLPNWIAADWGTRHLRLWLMNDAAEVIRGVTVDTPSGNPAQSLLALIGADLPASGALPVILCGQPKDLPLAPLAKVPCPPPLALASRVQAGPLALHLLAGLRQEAPIDLIRGPETTAAGFLRGLPDFDGVLCIVGPQTVWVQISAGEIVSFRSFMTLELLEMTAAHPILAGIIASDGWDEAAFLAAVSHALSRPAAIAADLLALRAEVETAGLTPTSARARLSGLLIGIELAAARPWWLGQNVVILGQGESAAAYRAALMAQGIDAPIGDAGRAALAGLVAARAAIFA